MPAIRPLVVALVYCAVTLFTAADTARAQIVTSDRESPDVVFVELLSPDVAEYPPIFVLAERQDRGSLLRPGGEMGGTQETTRTSDYRGTNGDGSNDRLIDRVVDPIAWLMQFRFREDWNWPVNNSGPDNQQFEFRPTIPFKAWDQVNLLRVTIPYDIEGSDSPGLDKVKMFDAVIFQPDWGRWGFGPEVQFNPHSSSGQDEFQIGPVFGAVAKCDRWTVGFICQNFLSGNNSDTQVQPILAYKFNEQWALALGDMQFKYDWNKKQWTQLPLGIELDYISNFWGQKINWFINPQYNFVTTDSSSGWTVFVGLTLLVPGA